MKRRIGLAAVLSGLCLFGGARAQTMFDGQLAPGLSTRADVERVLGAPLKQDSIGLFEYTPPQGAAGVQVIYRPDNVVSSITVTFPQPYERANLVQGLNLPAAPQPAALVQDHLQEYFGGSADMIFTYATAQSASGVIRLSYDSAETFAAEALKGQAAASLSAPALPDGIADALLPISANRAYNFNLRLLTFMSTASSRPGDAVRAQILSAAGADSTAANGGVAVGTIRAVICPLPGLNSCAIDFSLDAVLIGDRSIPIVCSLNGITNSNGAPHTDEEGYPIFLSSNYADAVAQAETPPRGARSGAHPDVIIEVSARSPSVSLAPGSLFSAGLNSDPSRFVQ